MKYIRQNYIRFRERCNLFEDCSVFLLREFGKTGNISVVRDKDIRDKNIRSKHRKRVPFSVFLPALSVRNCLLGSVPNPL